MKAAPPPSAGPTTAHEPHDPASPSAIRREEERQRVRRRILDAASELFAQEGYASVSMRQLAARIGYSPAAVYLHFKDKAELFGEVCRDAFAQFDAGFVQLQEIADPVERIRRCGRLYARFGIEHPHHYRLMFMTPAPPDVVEPEKPDDWDSDPTTYGYAGLRRSCQQAIAEGRFQPEHTDAELLAQAIWSAVHGVVSLQLVCKCHGWVGWRPVEGRLRTVLDGMLDGLVAR